MTNSTPPVSRPALQDAATALVELGGAWARYGLTIGRMAVETSARSLDVTAKVLGALAETVPERLAQKANGEAEPEVIEAARS